MTDALIAALFCCSFVTWGFACYRIGYWQCHTDNARWQMMHERDRLDDVEQTPMLQQPSRELQRVREEELTLRRRKW